MEFEKQSIFAILSLHESRRKKLVRACSKAIREQQQNPREYAEDGAVDKTLGIRPVPHCGGSDCGRLSLSPAVFRIVYSRADTSRNYFEFCKILKKYCQDSSVGRAFP